MARYGLYVIQESEGCDYTIGCGRNLYEFSADGPEEILMSIQEIVDDHGFTEGENQARQLTLVEIQDTMALLNRPSLRIEDFRREEPVDEEREKRYQQFLALKREFGNG